MESGGREWKAPSESVILGALEALRKDLRYEDAVEVLTGTIYDDAKSEAVLIHLAVRTLGRSEDINIVLASWALLRGYDAGELSVAHGGLGKRRNKIHADLNLKSGKSKNVIPDKEENAYELIAKRAMDIFADSNKRTAFIEEALNSYYDEERESAILPSLLPPRASQEQSEVEEEIGQRPLQEVGSKSKPCSKNGTELQQAISTETELEATPELEPQQEAEPTSEEKAISRQASQPDQHATTEEEPSSLPVPHSPIKKVLIPLVAGAALLVIVLAMVTNNRNEPSTSKSDNASYILSYVDGDDAGGYWGDSANGRQIYTNREVNSGALGDSITFNSIADGEFGDERNFVGAVLVDEQDAVWYGDSVEVEDGKTYRIGFYVHNDNPNGLNAIAEGVHAYISLPTTVSYSQTVIGYIDSSNSEPSRYWDAVTLYANDTFALEYVEGSAKYSNNGMGSITLTDDIIDKYGTPLGYDRFDGKIPGGHGYDGLVTIDVVAHMVIPTYISTSARLKGTAYWTEPVNANVGDEVEFQIKYINLSSDIARNVIISASLPDNMAYVDGSTVLYDSINQSGLELEDDTVTASGIDIGTYQPRGDAYIRFTAKVVDNSLANGTTQLVTWGYATVDGETYKNDVSTMVNK